MTLSKEFPGTVEHPGFINNTMESILNTMLGVSYIAFFAGLGWLGSRLIKRRNVKGPALLVAVAVGVLILTFLLASF